MESLDINTTPAMEAPEGQFSNLVNPYSLKDTRIGLSSAALGVSLFCVFIRVFVRQRMKNFNSEDWVLLFAMAAFVTLEAMLIVVALYADGKHMWDVSIAQLYTTLYYENIAEIMYCTTMFPIKFVLLHQVQSIFFSHDPTGTFRTTIRLLIVANFLLYLSLGLAFVFACTPREKIYHPMIEGTCISATSAMTASSGLNILSDLIILILPLFGIAKLQLPLKRKLLIASVFAVGIFAVIASCVRLYYSVVLSGTEDSSWVFMSVGNWVTIEFIMGFIVACSPYALRFFDMVLGRKEQLGTAALSYRAPTTANSNPGSKKDTSSDPNASWIALHEQDNEPYYTRRSPEVAGVPREW